MNRTIKTAFCALMAALASVFMLTSYFPYLTYAIPALAGLFIMVAFIETDIKWAAVTYIASSVLIFFVAEPEAKLLYIMFFGYYPIIKALFERVRNRVFEYLFKFSALNVALFLSYGVVAVIMDISLSDAGNFGKYTAAVLAISANVVFVIYDIAVSKMAQFYLVRIQPAVRKILKIK